MADIYDDLKSRAEEIKNEVRKEKNQATRIGAFLEDLTEKVKEVEGEIPTSFVTPGQLTSESTTRQQADNSLAQTIATEASTRQQADESLAQSIATEKINREQADTLQSEALSVHTQNKTVHVVDLGTNPDIDNLSDGRYTYKTVSTAQGQTTTTNYFLIQEFFSRTTVQHVRQFRFSSNGFDTRFCVSLGGIREWEEWESYLSAEIASLIESIFTEATARQQADTSLLEALLAHTANKSVHVVDLGTNPNIDDLSNCCYTYKTTSIAQGQTTTTSYFLIQEAFSRAQIQHIRQFRFSKSGFETRFCVSLGGVREWEEWEDVKGGSLSGISINGGPVATPNAEGVVDLTMITEADETLDSQSTNPVQNKAVAAAFSGLNEKYVADIDVDSETNTMTFFDANGTVKGTAQLPAGGGSGGEVPTTKVVLNLVDTANNPVIKTGSGFVVKFNFQHINTEDGTSTGETGIVTYTITRGASKEVITDEIPQGFNTLDVSQYLGTGSNTITIKVVTAQTGQVRQIGVTIRVIDLQLTSTYALNTFTKRGNGVLFPYFVSGAGTKTVFFFIDGVQVDSTVITTTTTSRNYTVNTANLAHGRHSLQVKVVMELEAGNSIQSNTLYYDLIIFEENNLTPIIGCKFVFPESEIFPENITLPAGKFETLSIDYVAYKFGQSGIQVLAYKGDVLKATQTPGSNIQRWNVVLDESGNTVLRLQAESVIYPITVNVGESTIDVEETTVGLELKLQAAGRSDAESNPHLWNYGEISTVFHNFKVLDPVWKTENETTSAHITNGRTIEVGFKPFASDFSVGGKTIEVDFMASNVANPESTIVDCFDEISGIGLIITAQDAKIYSSGGTTVETKFKAGERTRIGFVVKQKTDTEARMMYLYVNGIVSGAVQYADSEYFKQPREKNILIGNVDADVDIYNIRVYSRALSDDEMLSNYIVDKSNVSEMLSIYNRNNILTGGAEKKIDIDKLPDDLPVMVLQGDVNTIVVGNDKKAKGAIDIFYINKKEPARNFSCINGVLNLQGTSSLGYPRKNFNITLDNGKATSVLTVNGENEASLKYQFKSKAIPVNKFCLKADYAESSSSHNTGLARQVDTILRGSNILTPAQKNTTSAYDVRTTVDGFPILVFHRENADGELTFMGKYNFNNDKATQEVFGFENIPGYNDAAGLAKFGLATNPCQCVEFLANGDLMCLFKESDYTSLSGDGSKRWQAAFEFRYPDKGTDTTHLKKLTDWLVSTDAEAATNATIASVTINGTTFTKDTPAYRKAKFKSEVYDYFDKNFLLAYYVITEVFGAVDQRAKNMMFAFFFDPDNGNKIKAYPVFYDNDTILGVRNDGKLKYGYDIDENSFDNELQDYAYAGHRSVLWTNLQTELFSDVSAMYTTLRSNVNGLAYNPVMNMFNQEQSAKWCEQIYNMDAKYKYADPLIYGIQVKEGGNVITKHYNFLESLQGSRTAHRQWWFFNRLNLIDSKYQAGTYKGDYIAFRSSGATLNRSVHITSKSKMYYSVLWGKQLSERTMLEVGESASFACPQELAFGDVNYIYGASYIKKLNLTEFPNHQQLDVANMGACEELILGKSTVGWHNQSLALLELTGLRMLSKLDITNCDNVNFVTLDLSKNAKLSELYAEGTCLTSVKFAEMCPLKVVKLPATVQSFEIKGVSTLTESGLLIESVSNISRVRIEASPGIDSIAFLSRIMSTPGNKLAYIRITDINLKGDGRLLNDVMNAGIGGITENSGTQPRPVIQGVYRLTTYMSDEQFDTLSAYFEGLELIQPEYTAIEYEESISDPANISNLENKTGYKYGNEYKPSGHIGRILSRRHRVNAKKTAEGEVTYYPLHDDNSLFYADSKYLESATPAAVDGTEGDMFVYEGEYFYKGVNDLRNKKKYAFYSTNKNPIAPVGKKIETRDIQYTYGYALSVSVVHTTFAAAKVTNANFGFGIVDVENWKKARFQGICGVYGALFLDANNNILSRITGDSSWGMIDGMYLIASIPAGAVKLAFTVNTAMEKDIVWLTDSEDMADMEPDWVKSEEFLLAAKRAVIEGNIIKSRSGLNCQTALLSIWDAALYNMGSGYDYMTYSDWKHVANLSCVTYGTRKILEKIGFATVSLNGTTDSIGMHDTDNCYYAGVNLKADNCLGYEFLVSGVMAGQIIKEKCLSSTKFTTDTGRVFNIYPLTANLWISHLRHEKFMDVMLTGANGSATTYYTDQIPYYVGNVFIISGNDGNTSVNSRGMFCVGACVSSSGRYFRLRFSGKIVMAQSALQFKSIERVY